MAGIKIDILPIDCGGIKSLYTPSIKKSLKQHLIVLLAIILI